MGLVTCSKGIERKGSDRGSVADSEDGGVEVRDKIELDQGPPHIKPGETSTAEEARASISKIDFADKSTAAEDASPAYTLLREPLDGDKALEVIDVTPMKHSIESASNTPSPENVKGTQVFTDGSPGSSLRTSLDTSRYNSPARLTRILKRRYTLSKYLIKMRSLLSC